MTVAVSPESSGGVRIANLEAAAKHIVKLSPDRAVLVLADVDARSRLKVRYADPH